MKEKIINAVLDNMKDILIPKQLEELSSVLMKELMKYDIVERGSDEDVRNKENAHLTDNWVFECKIITIGCILDIWIFFLRLYQCNPMALPTQADACGSGAIEWFWQLVHRGWSPLPTYRISCDAGSDDLYGK